MKPLSLQADNSNRRMKEDKGESCSSGYCQERYLLYCRLN